MKRVIFTFLIILFSCTKGNSQTKIPRDISDEFGYKIIDNYKYGNGNTKLFIMEKLRRKGYKPMDIDVLVESIVTNTKNRDVILQAFHDLYSENGEYLYMNLYSLGISAASSKYLTGYIIEEKYKPINLINKKVEKPKIKSTNDALNSVSINPEGKYFKYLNNLNSYSPKISTVCEDQGYSDCLRDVTLFVKELAELRTFHLKNENNENYLKFYKTKTATIEKRNWEEDAKNIDKYIIENINIYEKTLKECGYDDLDWFKKLPKDLYKHFNLDKTEILNNIEVVKTLENVNENDAIYNPLSIEMRPDFPGGMNKFYKFIGENFKAPSDRKFEGGKILVKFVIEKDGTITDIKVIHDLGYGTKEEAIRVLKLSPKWIPAENNGEKVRTEFTLPIALSAN